MDSIATVKPDLIAGPEGILASSQFCDAATEAYVRQMPLLSHFVDQPVAYTDGYFRTAVGLAGIPKSDTEKQLLVDDCEKKREAFLTKMKDK
jgi:hypothetical protein